MTGRSEELPRDGIAIIGMAARLPGAHDLDAYWHNLVNGIGAVRRLEDAELRRGGFSPRALADPSLVRAFGVLDDVDCFDAGYFGYAPARAEQLDPQQRILLECAVTALEDAGYPGEALGGTIGAYLATAQSTYRPQGSAEIANGFFALTSSDKDYAATRVSYKLDLTGPSVMVQAACSSSLAAVHHAVEALLSGQCEMALAGGCSITLPQGAYRWAEGLMVARDGICRPFDRAASGAVPGNGCALVVLKPLADALADGDTVHAVIRGSALNNDGRRKADYLAPSVQGQARVIGEALTVAGLSADAIGYVEAHGTGTALGDPIEIRALTQAFRHFTEARASCAIGSVKASIGHLNVASGIAGLVKTVLMLEHGLVPPSLNFSDANPEIDFAATPFFVAREVEAWPDRGGPRRAGVSSFGFGGTNVHLVLEQAPAQPVMARDARPVLLPLSARTPAALERLSADMAQWLRRHPEANLADVAHTLAVGRLGHEHWRCVEATTAGEAASLLEGAGGDAGDENGRRWVAGENVQLGDPQAQGRRRIPLPTYPFERTRHWSFEAEADRPAAAPRPEPTRDVGAGDLLGWLKRLFAEELRVEVSTLEAEKPYDHYGVDSLLVVSLTGRLQETYPGLRSTVLFEHNTLGRLAAHLAGLEPAPGAVAAPSAAPVADADAGAIAVVGLAGRYPGAPDLDAFWALLRDGRSGVGEVPAERWDWRAYAQEGRADKSYTRWAGFIDEVDRFDSLFFGIAPREAKMLDPQQRLFLEIAWAAIEDAGYTPAGLKAAARRAADADVGVFAAVMNHAYRLMAPDAAAEGLVLQGNHWSVANRVSYHLDLTGPSLAVDTACSGSLAAVHLACESLRRGECGAAVVGGVNLILEPVQQVELCQMGMLSAGPDCRAFGDGADGFVQGEGVGALVLKPLEAARADGDHIYGVILGSAQNANGRTAGYTVPSPSAQAEVVQAALKSAGVAPAIIGYVECHGTGTALGDPIEINGLADAFGSVGGSVAVGSVKSNIGHLESAAGVASLTKVLLQLGHGELAPTRSAEPTNPRIAFERTAFRPQTERAPWRSAGPRRAGVSGFGAGGANVHLIVEEAPERPQAAEAPAGPVPVALSARDPDRLREVARHLLAHLRRHGLPDRAGLWDMAFTLAMGRQSFSERLLLVVENSQDLTESLERFLAGETLPELPLAGELGSVASAWRRGEAVDWSPFFAQPRRRLSLPTYPFARERHWYTPSTRRRAVGQAMAAEPVSALLGPAIPTLAAESRWRIALPSEHPVLAGHVVGGRPTLPGVGHLQLVREAARALGVDGACRFRQIAWLRPLVALDGSAEAELVLRRAGDELAFEIVDAQGAVFSRGFIAGTAGISGVGAQREAIGRSRPGAGLYDHLAGLGLDYAGAYRAVSAFGQGDGTAAADIVRAAGGSDVELLDACLQTAAAVLEGQKPALAMLPFSVESLEMAAELPASGTGSAQLIAGQVPGEIACFDIELVDASGRVAVRFNDVAARPARSGRTAAAVDESCFFAPSWQERALGETVASAGATIVLAEPGAGRDGLMRALAGRAVESHDLAAPLISDGAGEVYLLCPEGRDLDDDAPAMEVLGALRTLKAACATRRLRLVVVSVGAWPAGGALGRPGVAAAVGIARVAGAECPSWNVVCIDVERAQDIALAVGEAGDPGGLEIAIRGGRRLVRTLARLSAPSPVRPAFREGGRYLIAGGMGGIGTALALHLASRYRAKLALIGRAPATGERAVTLARIEAAGAEVVYLQAEITDPQATMAAVAEARLRLGGIDGAIHSAIVMEDRVIERMDDATFRAAFDVKRSGCLNLAAALRTEPLDWLAFFSSANSIAANAGQSNYVAGCVFKDVFAERLAREAPWPVHVIDWGFWGEVGRVATPEYRRRLERLGVHPIATDEGIRFIERLLGGEPRRTLVLKAEPAVLQRLGLVAGAPAAARDGLAAVAAAAREEMHRKASHLGGASAEYADLDALSRLFLANWWAERGLVPAAGEMVGMEELAARADVHPRHRRQLAALVEMLARDGVLSVVGDRVRRGAALASAGQPDLQAKAARFLAAHPHFEPHLQLLEVCLEAYGDVLADRRPATEVMFPDLSMRLVEPMYKGSRLVDFCNEMVATAVTALRRATDKKPFRVLEFGAGTGGASTFVLPALARAGEGTRYLYTDVSLGFTQFGQRRFGKDFPFVEFRPLDISRDPLAQGYEPASFDVLLACNCIHATPRLDRSLAHCRSLLAPGGFLVLYEMTALHDFVTITFGLLDGWWNAQDERMPHAPLLTTATWRERLAAAGFGEVEIFSEPGVRNEADFRHSIIVARSGPAMPVEKSEAKAARAPLLRGRLRPAGTEAPAPPVRLVETPAKPASAPGDLVAAVRELVAATLEMRLADLRTDKSLADYGADSVLSVTLVEALGRRFGIDLKPTILFSHPTIEALAAHLASRHGVSLAKAVPPAGPAQEEPAPAPRVDGGGSTDPSRQPIAVIGMAGRFPGADDVLAFWDNLAAGRCSVGPVPRERWDHAAVYDPDPLVAGRTSCPNGGFLGDIASFDPAFFGLSPADAVAMDPQQRIFLEEAWHALEDAGCPASRLSESKTGIFVGTIASDYATYLESVGRLADAKSFMGNSPSMLAARIAYHLNLRGPCLSIDTACSSSLVAIHLACESLRRGECSVALAGGVALMTTPAFYLVAGNAGMLSPTGQCRTLDEGADGFVPGEAAAVLVLKPLDAAMADGDRIYGVIRGSAVNQDGTSNGITAPRAIAQTELVRGVFERFDIDPSTLGYVELHGTGTKLGDPIEIDALREAFAGAEGRGFCGIGSVKSNIGHTLPAAGAVSLVKALLSLRNKAIPPTLHFSRPNRHLDLADGPFFVPTSLQSWESREGAPRRAAVSSFGFSGTNAHLVVEEAPATPVSTPLPGPYVVCLSAKTEAALARRIGDLARWMAEPQGQGVDIGDLAFTLATRRTHLDHRAIFVVSGLDDLRDQLSAAQAGGTGPDGKAPASGPAADLARLFLERDDEAFLAGFAALRRRVLSLPGYPFTRRRCWPVADVAAQAPAQTKPLDLFDLATGALAGNGGRPIGPMMGLSA